MSLKSTSGSSSDAELPLVRVVSLGPFCMLRRQDQQWKIVTEAGWKQRAVRSLLAYLLCCPERRASLSQVKAALWPKLDEESATHHLNKAIRSLGKVLSRSTITLQPLQVINEELLLADQQVIFVDADEFEAQAELLLLSSLPGEAVTTDQLQQREQALQAVDALYGGNFLPEEHDVAWVLPRRHSLRYLWSDIVLELAEIALLQQAPTRAIALLDRLLSSDPTNELAVQQLLVVLATQKRRGEALRAYKQFAKVLQRTQDLKPTNQTRELYECVHQGLPLPVFSPKRTSHVVFSEKESTSHSHSRVLSEIAPSDHALISFPRSLPAEITGRVHLGPLVGREQELAALRKMVIDVEEQGRLLAVGTHEKIAPLETQRRPQCVMVVGDAGMGKTRLAEEMSLEARERGWGVIVSRLYMQESGVPYRLWTEVLRKSLESDSGLFSISDPALLQPLVALLPELREYTSQHLFAQPLPTYILTPDQEQLRLWEAIANLLKAVSEQSPLLILLDDIQWADNSSHELLGYLARHLHGYPVLFLCTLRDTELTKHPPHPLLKLIYHMQREHTIQSLRLEPLSSEQIALLVSRVSPLPEATIKHIQDYAAGNPMFAEEFARLGTPGGMPKTIADVLKRRINKLSAECQKLLEKASVLGGSFELPVICSMETEHEQVDEEEVQDLLDEAIQASLMTDEGTGTRITYRFGHPLLVSHLYENISAFRRARLHQRAADVLHVVHQGREEEVAATIANHLIKAGADPKTIAHYAELAGNRAYSVFAFPEAQDQYRLAVEYLDKADVSSEQAHIAALLERLAACTMIRGHFADGRKLYERVLDLRRRLPTVRPQYEAQVQALLWAEIGLASRYIGDIQSAREACEKGEQVLLASEVSGGPSWARLYYLRSNLSKQAGLYDEALQMAQLALNLLEQPQDRTGVVDDRSGSTIRATPIQQMLAGDPIHSGRIHRLMGTIAHSLGQLSMMLTHQKLALAVFERYGEQRQIAHLSCDMGYILLKKAEYEQAQQALQRSYTLAESIGDGPLLALLCSNWGELAAARGDYPEAARWYRRALEMNEEDREYISLWNANLALVLQRLGQTQDAARCIRTAWKVGRDLDSVPCVSRALVTLGMVRVMRAAALKGRPHLLERARANIKRAFQLGNIEPDIRLRGALSLAQCSLLEGKIEEARIALLQVIADAQQHEMMQVVASAQQLLEQVTE
ncbi:ATP-binding protein [Tengunoibacter tsumagoiensis]|uniref:Transcriptional activator n=1 Tax=Tengunoibacter tsumagoiensis TaxID=2014871 RepID=A0A402A5T8_9CHLR|nr:AAA family ATPase [Tengunoibacter tsumagoiensis]GCE14472.1 transcriptional activator [Tengunoibacter tsumagoiensis]